MKNFFKLSEGFDPMPILYKLKMNEDLWNRNTLRTTHENSPHTQVSDIWFRFNDLEAIAAAGQDVSVVIDQHESIEYPAWSRIPEVADVVFALMARVKGKRLGRVILTKMAPGRQITPHIDSGDHAAYYERHHIVLQNTPGSLFHCGEETVFMRPGEVWWFDNKQMHSVQNNSAEDRITLIVDIKC